MTRKEKLEETRQKIKSATRELMESCENASEVTVRRISLQANVPLAMVNYCFGSREALLYEIFSEMSASYDMEQKIAEIVTAKTTPKEQLRLLYFYVARFLAKEYKFTEAVTGYTLLHRDLKEGIHTVQFVTAHFRGTKTDDECRLIAYELSSIVQLALCRKDAIGEFCGLNLNNEKDLQSFIDIQLDLFLQEV